MGSGSNSGTYVQAKARCCNLQRTVSCNNYDSERSTKGDDDYTIASCSNGEILTGYNIYYIYIYDITYKLFIYFI